MKSTPLLRPATLPLLALAFACHLPLRVTAADTAAAMPAVVREPTDISFGKRHTLQSKVLGREQDIMIFTPRGYEDSATHPRVPVLYFTDASGHYLNFAGVVEYLAFAARQIPPMILVGIANRGASEARMTDLTPTFSSEQKAGGEAAKLSQFLREEVIPYTEARYRAAPFRILAGHSLGGLFVLHVLREHPETFDAVIASSPSLWWDDRVLLKNTTRWGRDRQFLFFTMEQPDRNTVSQNAVREFSRILPEQAAPGLKWEFKGYPAEWHGSVRLRGFYDGLQFIFPDWNFSLAADLNGPVAYTQLLEHQAKLSQRYGYDIPVALTTVQMVVTELMVQRRFQDAAAFCAAHVERFPASSEAHALLAGMRRRTGDLAAARTHYQKAIDLDSKNAEATRGLAELSAAK